MLQIRGTGMTTKRGPRVSDQVFSRHSEKVPATGMISGDATRRALGKPDLPFWDVFLREALQNSWDARLGDEIDFGIDAVRFSADAREALRSTVFADGLPSSVEDDLGRFLDSKFPAALIVRDLGTRGLAGPARSDIAINPETRTDFRNFVFDIGRNLKRPVGGGTYGFGKGVLYEAGSLRTCLIYTRTEFDGALHDRFIATRVGSDFEYDNRRYTGRHWWGRTESDAVLPVEGAEAARLAVRLGMAIPVGSTGTVIAILDPVEPGASSKSELDQIMEMMRKAALRWAWPHLAVSPDAPSIRFSFTLLGERLSVSLDDEPELQQFAAAYREALKFQSDQLAALSFQVSADRLPIDPARAKTGVLVVRRALQVEKTGEELDGRVALMRGPRFVVKYVKVQPDPLGQYVAGVFLVDPSMEDKFAAAEPVTHDSWARESGGARLRPVAWTLTDIQSATDTRVVVPDPRPVESNPRGAAHLSRILGESIMGVGGTGVEKQPGRKPIPQAKSRWEIRVRMTGDPSPVEILGHRVVVDFPITVETRPGVDLSSWRILGEPRIVAEAGGRDGGGAGREKAEVLGWHVGDLVHAGAHVRADQLIGDDVVLRMIHDRDAAITVSLTKEQSL